MGKGGRRRWWRWGLALVVLGVLGAVPLGNVLLMVPAVKSRVEGKLGAVTGSKVTAGSICYWPWSGVVMRDVAMAEGGRVPGAVTVEEVGVELGLLSLFSDEIKVAVVRVVRPRVEVEWKQVNPVVVAAVEQAEESPPVEEPVQVPEATVASSERVVTGGGAEVKVEEKPAVAAAAPGKVLVIGLVEVSGGELEVRFPGIDAPLVSAEGIDLTSRFSAGGGEEPNGELEVGAVVLGGRVKAEGIKGVVVNEGSAVRFSEIVGDVGGGRVEGEVKLVPWGGGLPFEVSVKGSGIDVGEISGEGIEGFQLSGVLEGEVKLSGYGTVAETWRGEGGFRIAELGVSGGGTEVVLEPTEISGTLQGGWVNLERFYAHSDELALRASGGAVLDGRLGVNLRVYVDKAVAGAVAQKLELLGGGRPSGMGELVGTHYAFRDVAVRGTVGDPMLVLWEDEAAVRPGEFLRCFTPEGVPVEPFLAQ